MACPGLDVTAMADYEIQGPTRVCAATGRELKPGDRFHAVLTERDGKLVRTDYAAEAWPGAQRTQSPTGPAACRPTISPASRS